MEQHKDKLSLTFQFIGALTKISMEKKLDEFPMSNMGKLIPAAQDYLKKNCWNVDQAVNAVRIAHDLQ